jgi:hypothetical protein
MSAAVPAAALAVHQLLAAHPWAVQRELVSEG